MFDLVEGVRHHHYRVRDLSGGRTRYLRSRNRGQPGGAARDRSRQPQQRRAECGDGCRLQTDAGVTTITVDSTPKTTVVLSDEVTPAVKSVTIGELGAEGPSLAYVVGVSGAAAQATRDGNTYTVAGTGTGAEATDPTKPLDLPFEIAVTCP